MGEPLWSPWDGDDFWPVQDVPPMPLCECGHMNDRHGLGSRCVLKGCDCHVYRPVVEL